LTIQKAFSIKEDGTSSKPTIPPAKAKTTTKTKTLPQKRKLDQMTTTTMTIQIQIRTILKLNLILEATIEVWEVRKKKEWTGTSSRKKLNEKIEENRTTMMKSAAATKSEKATVTETVRKSSGAVELPALEFLTLKFD